MKLTLTQDDGSTQDFFPQSYTDAAVAAVTNATSEATKTVELKAGETLEVKAD